MSDTDHNVLSEDRPKPRLGGNPWFNIIVGGFLVGRRAYSGFEDMGTYDYIIVIAGLAFFSFGVYTLVQRKRDEEREF